MPEPVETIRRPDRGGATLGDLRASADRGGVDTLARLEFYLDRFRRVRLIE